MGQFYTQESVLSELRQRCAKSTQSDVARELGVSPVMVSEILLRKRPVSPRVALGLGYKLLPKTYIKAQEVLNEPR